MLETLREHSKGQDFSFRHSLVSRCAIRENARKFRDFSDPTPVFFLLVLTVAIITVFPAIVMVLPRMAFPT